MIRVIYKIDIISPSGVMISRRYARNKKTADKLANRYKKNAYVRKLTKREWGWIKLDWVEG